MQRDRRNTVKNAGITFFMIESPLEFKVIVYKNKISVQGFFDPG
jgi:hypothetical protein